MKYFSNIDLTVENNSHTQAYRCIQKVSNGRALKILEVGCSGGYFGQALMKAGHYVVGIEPDPESYLHASRLLNETYNGFVDDYFDKNDGIKFDVITYGDVLEHLVDPVEVLKRSATFLTENGYVVASIPNVAHSSVRAMLLEGRWDYSEIGLMDKTHLRFFTLSTMIDMFSNASYEVEGVASIKLTAEQVDVLTGMKLRQDFIKLAEENATDDRIHDFQYVILAKTVSSEESASQHNAIYKNDSTLRVTCVLPDVTSSLVDVRLRKPLQAWAATTGAQIKFISVYDLSHDALRWGDIFIFHRFADEYILSVIDLLHNMNKQVIFDMDDLLTELPDFLSHHKILKENEINLVDAIAKADYLTATTPNLLSRLVNQNNKRVIPNCTYDVGYAIRHYSVPSYEVNILLASSDKVIVDFVLEPLLRIQNEFAVKVHVIGPPSLDVSGFGIKISNYENMSYDKFKLFLASMDNTIGLIPLDNSVFSSCKSSIKYFDYSFAGIPTICSGVMPYSEYVSNGVNGVLVNNKSDDIYHALKELVIDANKRGLIAEQARINALSVATLEHSSKAWDIVFTDLKSKIIFPRGASYVKSSNFPSQPSRIKWAFRHLTSYSSYKKLLFLKRQHGWSGVSKILFKRYS